MKFESSSAETAATPTQSSAGQPPVGHVGEATENCRRILSDLMDLGGELAAMVAAQALAQPENPEAAQKSVAAYATLTRSIRRTIMLHEKLGEPRKPRRDRVLARRKIIRDVEDAIECHAPEHEQEILHAELLERLDRPDLEEEITARPVAEIVTDITRDLGVAGLHGVHPWKRRIPHDIAILNARAEILPGAASSEKLAALLATSPPRPHRSIAIPSDLSKVSDEDLETLLHHAGLPRESWDG
jgi:hypothetical protein